MAAPVPIPDLNLTANSKSGDALSGNIRTGGFNNGISLLQLSAMTLFGLIIFKAYKHVVK